MCGGDDDVGEENKSCHQAAKGKNCDSMPMSEQWVCNYKISNK